VRQPGCRFLDAAAACLPQAGFIPPSFFSAIVLSPATLIPHFVLHPKINLAN
jgi:hypothetical protein